MFQLLLLVVMLMCQHKANSNYIRGLQTKPLMAPKYGYNPESRSLLAPNKQKNTDLDHVWEQSGLHEGDIMIYSQEERNGILDSKLRWDNATIPFYIEESHFTDDEIKVILSSMKEYNRKTCIRFKPYAKSDVNWIIITGNETGCWSSVGMKGEGQQLNIHTPKCVRKGTVIHELLHAIGFYHQQSASNRDEYVKILWDNIEKGHENNFEIYNSSFVTDYGVEYDIKSIMHYSRKAFSKNGQDTIVPIQNITELGQRDYMTDKDIKKLNKMYENSCNQPEPIDEAEEFVDFADWFSSLYI
ncbi:unnamed protein product [Diamesa serratosioi]